ncbi:MAG: pyridoxine 5'-phosphate synthase [Spirochaetes bacterium]|nr:pyridoxine 5'-phosphate synthase [Spirochaetota bacterium]
MPKLGVNIDHIATIREARKTYEPDPVHAAALAELGGADGITVHLREDTRHIKPRDVKILRETVKTKLNLEMSVADIVVQTALKIQPDMATLVPEKREEVTTEGGLNVKDGYDVFHTVIDLLMKAGIDISLFVDPDIETLKLAKKLGVKYVELHTGSYANAKGEEQLRELKNLADAGAWANANGLVLNMGHGLNYTNIIPVLAIPRIHEFNIGHAIISRAVLVGLERAVRDMADVIERHRVD